MKNKKENLKESKWIKEIYKARIDDLRSVWQFKYKEKEGFSLHEQYLDEFQGKLEREGYLATKNLIAGTGIYMNEYHFQDGHFGGDGTNKCFLNVYHNNGSFITERGTYRGEIVLDEGWDFDVHITLKTPKGIYSKVKHNQLERELNKIIKRK